MKCKLKFFGHPLWKGNASKRQLSKIYSYQEYLKDPKFWEYWNDFKPGMLYNDCSGFNKILKSIEFFDYQKVNKHVQQLNGLEVILDAMDGSSCSFINCGVEEPRTQKQIEDYLSSIYDYEIANYDPKWLNTSDLEVLKARLQFLKNGGHLCDERGIEIPLQNLPTELLFPYEIEFIKKMQSAS